VPNWSSTSCDLGIFVYQPTKSVATSEVLVGLWRGRGEGPEWRCLAQCAVGPTVVEVHQVLGHHTLEVTTVDDQHSVQQFAADSADPSFDDRVRPRCCTGVRRMWMPSLAKTASKASVNLLSRSRIKNMKFATRSSSSISLDLMR